MDINGLRLDEISNKGKHYLSIYFIDSQVLEDENGLFAESVLLYGDEVNHLIPKEHCHRFNDDSQFMAASGFIRFGKKSYLFANKEYTVMLLYSDNEAFFLYLQEQDNAGNICNDILLVDFLKEEYLYENNSQ